MADVFKPGMQNGWSALVHNPWWVLGRYGSIVYSSLLDFQFVSKLDVELVPFIRS